MDKGTSQKFFLEEWNIRDVRPIEHVNRPEPKKPDIPRTISFTIDDWCKGSSSIIIARKRLRRVVIIEMGNYLLFQVNERKHLMISPDEFDSIVTFLFKHCGFEKWDEEYQNPNLLDGIKWEIKVTFDHKPDQVRCGSNAFPSCWNEVCSAFMKLAQM